MAKIVKEMKQTAWQQEMERRAAIKLRLEAEDMEQQRLAKTNLAAATVAFEAAAPEDKILAERVHFRAMVCEQEMRERKTGATHDMKCSCGHVKGRGNMCASCIRWRQALYGADNWVKYGSYNGIMC